MAAMKMNNAIFNFTVTLMLVLYRTAACCLESKCDNLSQYCLLQVVIKNENVHRLVQYEGAHRHTHLNVPLPLTDVAPRKGTLCLFSETN